MLTQYQLFHFKWASLHEMGDSFYDFFNYSFILTLDQWTGLGLGAHAGKKGREFLFIKYSSLAPPVINSKVLVIIFAAILPLNFLGLATVLQKRYRCNT